MFWGWLLLALFVALIFYWLFILTEGTFLGTRVVVLLYDWYAQRYDRVKKMQFVNELAYLGLPISRALVGIEHPLIVDIATGTGRLPLAMVRQPDFDGRVLGIEPSGRMLAEAQRALAGFERAALVRGDARALGLADASADAVTCLEALEFMTRPERVLDEMLRVLKPGGVLLLSNRVGPAAWFFPGRIAGRGALERRLRARGMTPLTDRWQYHYDLVWTIAPAVRPVCRRKDTLQR